MNWGPIDPEWGEGWDDFDIDPFADEPTGSSGRSGATVTRLPRARPGRRGDSLDRSITAPRPSGPRPAAARPTHRSAPRIPREPPPARPRRRPGDPRRRGVILKAALAMLLLAVVGKLVEVQVIDPERFVAVGEEQRLRTVELEASRGRILDRNGNDLALSVQRPSVFADPSQITEPRATAQALAPVLGLDVNELTDSLSRDSQFVYLSRRIEDGLAARVVELDLDGIHLHEEPTRFTPSESLARSIIGDVASDQTGSSGIEKIYDEVLTGTPGELEYERARDGGTIAAAGVSRVPAQPGTDVVLTLDRSLQYEAERLLAQQVADLDAKGGIVVVTRPSDGEILALANITRNTDGEIITAGANRAITDVFEPGSVNKVITIAAALEEGLVQPSTTMPVPDHYRVADHVFGDDHEHPTVPMSVTEILAQSSNVGTIMLGEKLGKERIDSYLRDFGFGKKTALDFPFESPGILLDPEDWSGTSIGTIPIGQGIAVTAMQMVSAYNVIANDGVYVKPRLVDATIGPNGVRTPTEVGEGRRVVSEETAAQVRAMLVEAVENGTGENAKVEGYSVGGKTGTARKPQGTGTYKDLAGNYHYVAGFTGMVPAEAPELSIGVFINEPTTTIYGASAAAPLFADLAQFALSRFRIPPVVSSGATLADAAPAGE